MEIKRNPNCATGRFNDLDHAVFFVFDLPDIAPGPNTRTERQGFTRRRADLDSVDLSDPGEAPQAFFAYENINYINTVQQALYALDADVRFLDSPCQENTAGGETVRLFEVFTPVRDLRRSDVGRTDIYADLRSGSTLGSRTLPSGESFAVSLNGTGQNRMLAADRGLFAIGASIPYAREGEYAFSFIRSSATVQLRIDLRYREERIGRKDVNRRIHFLTTDPVIPEPGTVTLLTLGGLKLLIFALRRKSQP